MKNTLNLSGNAKVFQTLSTLPEKMLKLHGTDNVSAFVLYELCHQDCFNLPKAAFFVENPDFTHFKGVAGFNKAEHTPECKLWEQPDDFTRRMAASGFNQKVRAIDQHADPAHHEQLLTDVAHQLDVRDLGYHRFPLKHGNNGYIVYDRHDASFSEDDLAIVNRGACLLGFCPIF